VPEPIITIRATPELVREVDAFAQRFEMSRSGAAMFLVSFGLRHQRDAVLDLVRSYSTTGGRSG
jgi:hypothetical protein